jgi:hypothetical protein
MIKTSKVFRKFLKECKKQTPQNLYLDDFLIMPVQRIPRYNLLLEVRSELCFHSYPNKFGNELYSPSGTSESHIVTASRLS